MKKTKDAQSYQELKQTLDEILAKLQHDDTDIDEAVELHARGVQILNRLETYLREVAENTAINIKKIG